VAALRVSFAMLELVNIPLLFRGFGVLFAIAFFLQASTCGREPWPKDVLGFVLPALMLVLSGLTCVPFSRIRSRRIFWTLFSVYAAAFLGFVAIQTGFAIRELGTPSFRINFILIVPVALLLFVQFPCILYSLRKRGREN
jgi:hypothetical protein